MSPDQYRQQSHELARDAVACLARAVNRFSTQEIPYRYSPDVHDKMLRLSVEIARLIEHGDIEPNPANALYKRAVAARSDKTLQTLLRQASKGRRGRSSSTFKGQSS